MLLATLQLGWMLLVSLDRANSLPVPPETPKITKTDGVTDRIVYFKTEPSSTSYNGHQHKIDMSKDEMEKLNKAFCDDSNAKFLDMKETEESFFHFHQVTLCRERGPGLKYRILKCDGKDKCWDGHSSKLENFFQSSTQTTG